MFTISKHQPCGVYRVDAHALSGGVEAPVISNYIDVICFHHFDFDQSEIVWDQIVSGSTNYTHGDFTFALDDGAPTVINRGNSGLSVGVRFSKMLSQQNPTKIIEHFDACFGTSSAVSQGYECKDPIVATQDSLSADTVAPLDTPFYYFRGQVGTDFDPDKNGPDLHPAEMPHWPRGTVVCQNQTAKLTLSLHAPASLVVGHVYSGDFEIVAYNSARWGPEDPNSQDADKRDSLVPRDPFDPMNLGRCWSDNGDYIDAGFDALTWPLAGAPMMSP